MNLENSNSRFINLFIVKIKWFYRNLGIWVYSFFESK